MHGANMTFRDGNAQKAASRAGRAAVEAAYVPAELDILRAAGRGARTLPCRNETEAVSELARYGFAPDSGHVPTAPPPSPGKPPAAETRLDRDAFAASGLFDPDWYADVYPDVALGDLDPLDHFLRYGRMLDRSPGPDFDPVVWRSLNPGLHPATDPLAHFMATRRNG